MDKNKGAAATISQNLEHDFVEDLVTRGEVSSGKMIHNVNGGDLVTPAEGMIFESYEAVCDFYNKYGRSKGFGTIKKRSEPGDTGQLISFTLACSKSGKPKHGAANEFRSRQPSSKTNCMARIKARLTSDGLYCLSVVVLDHNHELSPSKAYVFRSNKRLKTPSKRHLERDDPDGIGNSNTSNSFVLEHGGHESVPSEERDCINYTNQFRELRLREGDVEALFIYFMRMQKRDPDFFYAIDVNEENRLRNVFWADGRCRAAYLSFNDVIRFDSSYLTDKCDMPFVHFAGVNHHGQIVLLGCGLLLDENTETFVWLFKAWLECMSGVHPSGIIVDQCKGILNAIAEVFPYTHHRCCIWHIMRKLPENLGTYSCYQEVRGLIHDLVYNSLRVSDFEQGWMKMIKDYELENNDWLKVLFEDRHHWVPVYVKDTLWAGMLCTEHNESMNSFFDDHVCSKTTLKQFIDQYDMIIQKKMKQESDEDFRSSNTTIPLITDLLLEKQISDIYTIEMFKKYQNEVKSLIFCSSVAPVAKSGQISTFNVKDCSKRNDVFGKAREPMIYEVVIDIENMDIKCICQLFEFKGIVCRHALCVLMDQDISTLPPQYILSRWRKDIKRPHPSVKVFFDDFGSKAEIVRYKKLHARLIGIAQKGAKSQREYDAMMRYLGDMEEKFNGDNLYIHNLEPHGNAEFVLESNLSSEDLNPVQVQKKGPHSFKRKAASVKKIEAPNSNRIQKSSEGKEQKFDDHAQKR